MVSLPAPPSSVSVTLSAGSVAAERVSLPAPPETMRASIDSDPLTVTTSGRPVTTRAPFWLCTSITSLPLVPLTVTLSAARSPAPLPGIDAKSIATCVTPVPVRSPTTIVSAPPLALTWMCSMPLRSMVTAPMSRVKRTRLPFAEMLMFSLTLAPLNTSVGAVLAFDDVAAVARIPDERVVTRAELCRIVAAAARDDVVAIAAEQRVVAVAAGDRVVARAAVDRQVDEGSETVSGRKSVVAAVHVEDEIFGGADVEREGRGADAVDAHARAVRGDGECLGSVAAVDLGGIDAVAAFEEVGALARIPYH